MIIGKCGIFVILLLSVCVVNQFSLSPPSFATDNLVGTCVHVVPLVYIANETGEIFNINVNISGVNNLQSVEFKLTYNTSLLDAVHFVQKSFLPSPPQSIVRQEINESAGFVWMNITIIDSEVSVNGDGTLARITFNATLDDKCSCSVLNLQETSLRDDSMISIDHTSIDGLYFWKTTQPDPPPPGALLDLYTQKGGIGSGESGGSFVPGEMVELRSYVTYNDWPEQQKLVAFQVIEPIGSTVLVIINTTDQNGIASTKFRISTLPDSYGWWTAVSVCEVAGETVWDIVVFWCSSIPVGGFSESLNIFPHRPLRIYHGIIILVMTSCFIILKHKAKKKIDSTPQK